MLRHWILSLALTTVACGGDAEQAQAPADAAPEAAPAKPAEATFDMKTLTAEAVQVALVPSPAEMQKALSNAGLTTQLAKLLEAREISMDVENKDQIAVRTGVVLAELVLSVKTAEDADQLARLAQIKEGFSRLGAGKDVATTIDELTGRIKTGAGSKDDLLKEFDELSGVLIPELKYEAGDWVVPLIQAGSWVEGAHLVAGAIKAEGKYEEAGKLLKQPAVVDYFLSYMNREGRNKAPDQVVAKLEETLTTLKEITAKDSLTEADVNTIHSATGAVLTLL